MTASAWTEARIERLKTLWLEGRTAEQIATELQNGIRIMFLFHAFSGHLILFQLTEKIVEILFSGTMCKSRKQVANRTFCYPYATFFGPFDAETDEETD